MSQLLKYLFSLHEILSIPKEERFWDASIDKLKEYLNMVSFKRFKY